MWLSWERAHAAQGLELVVMGSELVVMVTHSSTYKFSQVAVKN